MFLRWCCGRCNCGRETGIPDEHIEMLQVQAEPAQLIPSTSAADEPTTSLVFGPLVEEEMEPSETAQKSKWEAHILSCGTVFGIPEHELLKLFDRESQSRVIQVVIRREHLEPLGMSLITFSNDYPVISHLYDGVIKKDGRIQVGDQIREINSISFLGRSSAAEIHQLCNKFAKVLCFTVFTGSFSKNIVPTEEENASTVRLDDSIPIDEPLPILYNPLLEHMVVMQFEIPGGEEKEPIGVELTEIKEVLRRGIFVDRLVEGAHIERPTYLKPGDQIHSVNGRSVDGLDLCQTVVLIKKLHFVGNIQLRIIRRKGRRLRKRSGLEKFSQAAPTKVEEVMAFPL